MTVPITIPRQESRLSLWGVLMEVERGLEKLREVEGVEGVEAVEGVNLPANHRLITESWGDEPTQLPAQYYYSNLMIP